MPAVSVIMATYNWSTVLPFSIASVLDQTFEDFELLVIGDGCTDDSEQVVFRIEDPRVSWVNLPQNTGHQSGPNNEGLRRATGKYIAYMGHDDLWLPHHLELLTGAIEESGAALVHGITAMIRPDDTLGETIPHDRGQMAPAWLPPGSVIHSRELALQVGGWRDYRTLKINPEADLYERIQAEGGDIRFLERLTLVKFATAWRRDAYKERPFQQQEAWLQRIRSEPDLERRLLAQALMTPRLQNPGERAWVRAGALKFKLLHSLALLRGDHDIDFKRRFKGLPRNPRL